MTRHLTPADYVTMPWANGRGQTVELIRVDDAAGRLLWRLSMAAVVEDGPFSLFPGVERNLTVIGGPGFRLTGPGVDLTCRPLVPVAFAGDVAVQAVATGGQRSDDFNVLTARALGWPEVRVARGGKLGGAGTLCLFALEAITANDRRLAPHDLLITQDAVTFSGSAIAITLPL